MTCKFYSVVFALLANCPAVFAQEKPPQWVTDGPFIEEHTAAFEIPLQVLATKLYVEIEIGGKPRRFVVDTGSPSMIDGALAEELGLQKVGSSQGTDAHGVVVRSDIIQATLTIGGVKFQKVPMFSAPFSAAVATRTFIGDGVLGSEVLPLGAWQIDLDSQVLRFNTDVTELPYVADAERARLYDFAYPHAPIVDVRFAKKARSKAMFDTGSPSYFAISPGDFEGARKAGGIGKTLSGYGSPGRSLGGQAPNSDQLQAELKSLALGDLALGRVGAQRRESSPSLIGASLLEQYIVTFDSKGESFYLHRYAESPLAQSSFGFTLSFDEQISVALVWNKSAAAKAGLSPGLVLKSINNVPTEPTQEVMQQAIEALQGQEIFLEWEGGSALLSHKSSVLD